MGECCGKERTSKENSDPKTHQGKASNQVKNAKNKTQGIKGKIMLKSKEIQDLEKEIGEIVENTLQLKKEGKLTSDTEMIKRLECQLKIEQRENKYAQLKVLRNNYKMCSDYLATAENLSNGNLNFDFDKQSEEMQRNWENKQKYYQTQLKINLQTQQLTYNPLTQETTRKVDELFKKEEEKQKNK